MSAPITPMDLFREFTARGVEERAANHPGAVIAYDTIVDLTDGMLKGLTRGQWLSIYLHLRDVARDNRNLYVTMGDPANPEALAWNEIMDTLDIAIALSE